MNQILRKFQAILPVALLVLGFNSFAQTTYTFNYTGAMQTWVVPGGVTSVGVTAMGAGGGLNSVEATTGCTWGPYADRGGYGACVVCTVTVTPGSTIYVYVGGKGGDASATGCTGGAVGTGGYNGGAAGAYGYDQMAGGGGGGASDIRIGGTALANRVVVAGGGGGAGLDYEFVNYERGGDGGTTTAENGWSDGTVAYGVGGNGAGGSPTAGGAGGNCTTCYGLAGTSGSLGNGGAGGGCCGTGYGSAGGGGGGGYYGGGGGQWAGGGGGSSYTSPTLCTSVTNTRGCNTDTLEGQVTITVECNAGTITGTLTACTGSTTALTDAATGGTWSSSNTAVATVNTTGVVSGVAAGTATITYTNGGCSTTATVTVYAMPTGILGTLAMCKGATTTLSDLVGGGVWSTTAGTGSVNVSTVGVVTGVVPGTATVSYTTGGPCYQTVTVTVYATPTTISGTASVCVGLTTSLSDGVTGGTWTSSNTSIATVVSTTGLVTGVAGGSATITYTLPGNCYITQLVNVNPAPSPLTGATVCQGLTVTITDAVAGGTWSSSNTAIATINTTGVVTGVAGGTTIITYTSANCTPVTAVVTVNPVDPISPATPSVCAGLSISLSDAITGTWSSSNMAIATIGSSSGSVFGVSAGTVTITCVYATGCEATVTLVVNPSPQAISGTTTLCSGYTTTLTDATTPGTWTSSNTSIVSIVSTSGFVTAVTTTGGTATITYTLPAGCTATTTFTVNPNPAFISGTLNVCAGVTTLLTDATPGGSWTSGNSLVATIASSSSGSTYGNFAGTAVITYTLPTGCYTANVVTVNPSPVAIEGVFSACAAGGTTTLSDPTTGGTWSTSNTTIATIGGTTGIVTGGTSGTATITYTLAAGCTATTTITVSPLSPAISGTPDGCIGFTTTLTDISTGGTWTSTNSTVATIVSSSGFVDALTAGTTTIVYTPGTSNCAVTLVFTVNPQPAAISGTPNICAGLTSTFTDASGAITWSSTSSNVIVGPTTGIVEGVNPGTAIITFTLPTTCWTTYTVNITTPPTLIGGPSAVCLNSEVTLTDGVGSGTWNVTPVSGAAGITGTGVVTGTGVGVVIVSYTTTACPPVTYPVIINPLPDAIVGIGDLCAGSSTSLTDATAGGSWTSSNSTTSVSSTGLVSGVSAGSGITITYALPTGCYATAPVIVFPMPGPINGTDTLCPGASVVFTDDTSGGIWSSSNGTIARSIAVTGEVDALVGGSVTISYTLISGCYVVFPVIIQTPVPATLTMTQTPNTLLCAGTPVTLTAFPVNGGTPTFEWELFGSYIGSGLTYTYPPQHGDYITCVMTTHDICASPATVSTSMVINVNPNVTPIVTITSYATSDSAAYLGESYTFYTDVTNGGDYPNYQWYINSAPVAGATSSSFTTHVYDANDTIYCIVSGDSPCDVGSFAGVSNNIILYGLGYLSVNTVNAAGNDLNLFPNPNTGSFTLSGTLSTLTNKDVALEVTDMLGRTVYTGKTTPDNGAIRAEITLGDIAGGTYLLRVFTDAGTETFHFVVGR